MRLARVAAGALVGAVVLAGCSNKEPANETLPTPSSTTAASETLPPLGPADMPMPDEARSQTSAGAEAFIRYYINLYNAAQTNLDSTYMRQLSQACETCDQLSENINEDAQSHRKYEGGIVTLTSVSEPSLSGEEAQVTFSMDQAPLIVRDENGKEIVDLSAPSATLQCGAVLKWSTVDSTWTFSQWDVN